MAFKGDTPNRSNSKPAKDFQKENESGPRPAKVTPPAQSKKEKK